MSYESLDVILEWAADAEHAAMVTECLKLYDIALRHPDAASSKRRTSILMKRQLAFVAFRYGYDRWTELVPAERAAARELLSWSESEGLADPEIWGAVAGSAHTFENWRAAAKAFAGALRRAEGTYGLAVFGGGLADSLAKLGKVRSAAGLAVNVWDEISGDLGVLQYGDRAVLVNTFAGVLLEVDERQLAEECLDAHVSAARADGVPRSVADAESLKSRHLCPS